MLKQAYIGPIKSRKKKERELIKKVEDDDDEKDKLSLANFFKQKKKHSFIIHPRFQVVKCTR